MQLFRRITRLYNSVLLETMIQISLEIPTSVLLFGLQQVNLNNLLVQTRCPGIENNEAQQRELQSRLLSFFFSRPSLRPMPLKLDDIRAVPVAGPRQTKHKELLYYCYATVTDS